MRNILIIIIYFILIPNFINAKNIDPLLSRNDFMNMVLNFFDEKKEGSILSEDRKYIKRYFFQKGYLDIYTSNKHFKNQSYTITFYKKFKIYQNVAHSYWCDYNDIYTNVSTDKYSISLVIRSATNISNCNKISTYVKYFKNKIDPKKESVIFIQELIDYFEAN
jgi:hypothetical protein